MISEEMLHAAAARSSEIYVNDLENGYDPNVQHEFSPAFEKKISKLKHRADHPMLYQTMRRVASFALVLLISGSIVITANAEARAAFVGWVKEVYESFFVYRFSGDADISTVLSNYEPNWIPDGYSKSSEIDDGGKIAIFYQNAEGQILRVHYVYRPNETDIFVDADNGQIKKASVGEYSADLVLIDDPSVANDLMWVDENNCVFCISAFLDEDDLLRVANSIYEK